MIEKINALGLSKQEIAESLGITRPTLAKVERGERKLKKEESRNLEVLLESFGEDEKNMRINIPQKDLDKFKQVFLYILDKVGAKPNIGMTVLYKLLYFIDFDYYEKYEEQCMGLTYFKNLHGPTPREFKVVVDSMIAAEEVSQVSNKFFKFEQRKYLPIKNPDLRLLNGREVEMIDSVLERYADKTATQISDMSHRDTPWKATKDGEDIDYELAFYRPDEFSVREYEAL